jgi:hypothetical protein
MKAIIQKFIFVILETSRLNARIYGYGNLSHFLHLNQLKANISQAQGLVCSVTANAVNALPTGFFT